MGQIKLPKPPKTLKYVSVDPVPGMLIPNDDEDFDDDGFLKKFLGGLSIKILFAFIKALPCSDEPSYFDNNDEYTEILQKHFVPGKVFPDYNEKFDDLSSDETISQMAFYGMGLVILQKSVDGDTFEVDTTALGTLKIREGFEKYGAKAVFAMDKTVSYIYVCAFDKDVFPGDEEWEHAKWVWRISLLAFVNIGPHMVQLHWTTVNSCHIAERTLLGANHPIRRVLKPFLYYSGAINLVSTMYLAPENSLLHRATTLEYEGGVDVGMKYFASVYKYQTFPTFLKSKGLNEEDCSELPLFTDALPIWNALHKFFTSYVDIFYADDNAVYFDKELAAFWERVDKRGDNGSPWRYGLPFMNKKSLVDYLTHIGFNVTAWHEICGNFAHYILPPYGMGLKLYPGKEQLDIQGYIQSLTITTFTGLRNPLLMSDWKYLLPDHPEAKALHDILMTDLQEISEKVDSLNEAAPNLNRPRKFESFNPKYLECSVSV